jgi:RNA polymerase sigma factor (sigma-70 family)
MIKGVKLGSNIVQLGSNVGDVPNLVFIGDLGDGKKVYRREGEKMKIGDAEIEIIMYGFYKDRLEDMQIHFRSSSNFEKLKEKLFQLCGPSHQPNAFVETYHWYGEKFSLFLTYSRKTQKGVIGYTFFPIYRERREDNKLQMVNSWLALLTDMERAVITLRFGFGREDALTVESTGESLGLTPESIRQIEAEAIEKLQKISEEKENNLAA